MYQRITLNISVPYGWSLLEIDITVSHLQMDAADIGHGSESNGCKRGTTTAGRRHHGGASTSASATAAAARQREGAYEREQSRRERERSFSWGLLFESGHFLSPRTVKNRRLPGCGSPPARTWAIASECFGTGGEFQDTRYGRNANPREIRNGTDLFFVPILHELFRHEFRPTRSQIGPVARQSTDGTGGSRVFPQGLRFCISQATRKQVYLRIIWQDESWVFCLNLSRR